MSCGLLGPIVLTGCSDDLVCTTDILPAVVVEIRDAQTGEPRAAEAEGTIREGTFSDSLRAHGSTNGVLFSRAGADERAGRYTVEVNHEGYLPWQVTDVGVSRNSCHVETVTLQADLEPAP